MTTTPKIKILLALAALAVLTSGCGKTAVRTVQNVDTAQTAPAAPGAIHGTFTDSRDGQTYRTVRIGNMTWMAENLNFVTDSSACYDNEESNCQKYGRLYTWDDAMKACPAPWRVPADEDWDKLGLAAGGERKEHGSGDEATWKWDFAGIKLKSTTGWEDWEDDEGNSWPGSGTDEFGFSAKPGGGRFNVGIYIAGYFGYWWSATEHGADRAWCRGMYNYSHDMSRYFRHKQGIFSLRCIQ